MPSLWEKLEWREKAWLGAVYSVSLLLTFLVAYNLGRGSESALTPSPSPTLRERGEILTSSPSPTLRERGEILTSSPSPAVWERGEDTVAGASSGANTPVQEIDLSMAEASSSVTVHVAGQVNKPGVYTLPPRSRIRDALQQAGGAKPDADLDGVNLAEPLSDGQKIYVPRKEETRVDTAFNKPRAGGTSLRSLPKSPPRFPLDINRATAEQLEQLPGIGPVLAARIVAYRQMRGRFQSVDELIEVQGIGPKRLEQIRPYVVVR